MEIDQGFVQLRRGLSPHMREGKMSPAQVGVFSFLLLEAYIETGVWMGNAEMLAIGFGMSITTRQARQLLESLDSKYIRRFSIIGSRRPYPILIHGYLVTKGARSGMVLNAWKSSSYEQLVWEYPPGGRQVDASCAPGRRQVDATPLHPPKAKPEKEEVRTKTNTTTNTTAQDSRRVRMLPVEKSKATPQRVQYAQTAQLIATGQQMLAKGEVRGLGEIKEKLKEISAAHGLSNYGTMCGNAAEIAVRRHEGTPSFARCRK